MTLYRPHSSSSERTHIHDSHIYNPDSTAASAAAAAARRFSGTTGYEKSSPLLGEDEGEDEDAIEHHFDAAFGGGDGVQLATFSPPKQR